MARLTVGIASRNEQFLLPTILDVLKHRRLDTEIIVVLDGAWPTEPIPDHPDVHLVYHPVSIGQRAAINETVRLSSAEFVMKLDAHCAVDEGFDAKMLARYDSGELDRTVTSIPAQHRLHVYNRVCKACGHVEGQGPMEVACAACSATQSYEMQMVWKPRHTPSTSWVMDAALHFQYDTTDKCRLNRGVRDVMTSLGACWVMTRDRWQELGGLDERIGSWGQVGAEVACKSWLSGGRHVVNTDTWFAHFFRVGGIGFPYPMNGSDQDKARKRMRRTWEANEWPGQVKPLSWLVRKFQPVHPKDGPKWPDQGPAPRGGVVYFSHGVGDARVLEACRGRLLSSLNGHALVTSTQQPMAVGKNVVVEGTPSPHLSYFRQILAGLEACDADYVFLAEHDCIYPPEHFAFIPPRDDRFYYNMNVWRVDSATGRAVTHDMMSVSGLCANRGLLLDHYRKMLARVEAKGYYYKWGHEPGIFPGRIDPVSTVPAVGWRSAKPYVDIRHGN